MSGNFKPDWRFVAPSFRLWLRYPVRCLMIWWFGPGWKEKE